jgi:type IV secretion system protein VirB5
MKRIKVFSKIAVILFGLSGTVQAGIPVIDAASLAQQVQQVASWITQLEKMESQLSQLQQQYNNLSGIRNMGSLVNNPALRQYMPAQYQSILSAAGGFGNQSAIRTATTIFNTANSAVSQTSAVSQNYNQVANQTALNRALAEAGYNSASQHFNDIQVLLDKVNNAPDAKDMADLQGRIQAEQVMVQNENNKLSALLQLQQAQTDLANQQAVQIRMLSTHGPMPAGYGE